MKYLILIAAAAFCVSCGSNNETSHEGHQHETEATVATNSIIDPVCKMEKGDNWTEYSLNGADTVWFCSPHCKESYDKDPAKFAAAE